MLEFLAHRVGRAVLLLSQALLTTVIGTDPWFQDVNLEAKGKTLFCSTTLMDSFTSDLDKLLQSGDTVSIHFEFDIMELETDRVVAEVEWIHSFHYSLLEDRYTIRRTELGRKISTDDFNRAKFNWVKIENAPLCKLDVMDEDTQYYLRVAASLADVNMPGITDKLNMMVFWNRIRPVYTSQPFKKMVLQ